MELVYVLSSNGKFCGFESHSGHNWEVVLNGSTWLRHHTCHRLVFESSTPHKIKLRNQVLRIQYGVGFSNRRRLISVFKWDRHPLTLQYGNKLLGAKQKYFELIKNIYCKNKKTIGSIPIIPSMSLEGDIRLNRNKCT